MLIYYLYMYWGVFLNLCEEASKEGSCRKIRGFSTKHDFSQINDLQYSSMFDPQYSIFNVLHDVLPTILQPFNYFPTTADQAMCADFPSREIFTQTFKILYLDFLTHTIMSLIRRDSSGISKCSSLLKILSLGLPSFLLL